MFFLPKRRGANAVIFSLHSSKSCTISLKKEGDKCEATYISGGKEV